MRLTNRYALFMGSKYYPNGGMKDLVATHPSESVLWMNAQGMLDDYTFPWVHIYDLWEGKFGRKWQYNTNTEQMEEVDVDDQA